MTTVIIVFADSEYKPSGIQRALVSFLCTGQHLISGGCLGSETCHRFSFCNSEFRTVGRSPLSIPLVSHFLTIPQPFVHASVFIKDFPDLSQNSTNALLMPISVAMSLAVHPLFYHIKAKILICCCCSLPYCWWVLVLKSVQSAMGESSQWGEILWCLEPRE